MQIKRQTYPLYYKETPDYLETFFDVNIDTCDSKDALHITLIGDFILNDPDLKKYIDSNQAKYALMVDCPTTNYKQLINCSEHFKETLIKANLNDIVTITPMIIAIEDIVGFTHNSLSKDYKGAPITIPNGGIIALDDEFEIMIERGTPRVIESICKFRSGEDYGLYDYDNDSINIYVSEEIYSNYKSMNRYQRSIMTAMYFPPIFQDIIQRMYIEKDPDMDVFENSRWAISISDAIEGRGIVPKEEGSYNTMMAILGAMLDENSLNITQTEEFE